MKIGDLRTNHTKMKRLFIPSNAQLYKRCHSDEHYIINLCDEVLGEQASRQHSFDFLRGDKRKLSSRGRKLPVDAYYDSLNLVVEYYERQHFESVKYFNKKDTISGVTRDEQRKIYDERRKKVLPEHGIDLVIFSYNEFKCTSQKRLIRDEKLDIEVVKQKLMNYINAQPKVKKD